MIPFTVANKSNPPLLYSPSPFRTKAWTTLLLRYPGTLPATLADILTYGCDVGYEGPETLIISKNLQTTAFGPEVLTEGLMKDISLQRVTSTIPASPYICSPLGLVRKHDGGWRKIHHLSYPGSRSVNANIPDDYSPISYSTVQDILDMVRQAGKGSLLVKRDISDAFRNIPVAPTSQWLLGFQWNNKFYQEAALPFGLSTAPFIFNLFSEALHWILQSWLDIPLLRHLLDDFIYVIPLGEGSLTTAQRLDEAYRELTDLLGVPRNDKKDCQGTTIIALGVEIDSVNMIARLPADKLQKVLDRTTAALEHTSITLDDIEKLCGYLSFCSSVVRLGWVYMRNIWTFVASFPNRHYRQMRRRLPPSVRDDIQWWNSFVQHYNGIHFFDTVSRETIHLYTDASALGMGGFYFEGATDRWSIGPAKFAQTLTKCHAFSAKIVPPALGETFDINPFEIAAIWLAFTTWGHAWRHKRVVIHTDSSTARDGLTKHTLRGVANVPLRKTLLLAASLDVDVEPHWLPGKNNELADALSRFDYQALANWCPHWQNDFDSILLQNDGWTAQAITQTA